MAGMYPSLQERFKNEGMCPICMMPMGLSPKYACENDHTMCHRCKPYYYACPSCNLPMDIEILPPVQGGYHMPPAMHYMPHPYPPYPTGNNPSAPFLEEERHSWAPPTPTEDQELNHCSFRFAGCEARFPEHLRRIHESRCQFRPNLEEDKLSTDLDYEDEGALQDCRYRHQGCNVRLAEWRKVIHETTCIYKEKIGLLDGVTDRLDHLSFCEENAEPIYDPEELVNCRYERYGCTVKVPRRRKSTHEEKCNWATKCTYECDEEENSPDEDPDERVACQWAEYGCQVRPRRCRKETHDEKCNYRMEPCSYRTRGCDAILHPSRKYAHERSCEYA